jgi:hypothetical protein
MLHHYEKYKHYEAPVLKQTKYDRGYSFYKTDNLSRNREERQASHSIDGNLTDNFYFPNRREKPTEVGKEGKKPTPSCIFKN